MSDSFVWICAIAVVSLLMNVVQYWVVCTTQVDNDELQFKYEQAETGRKTMTEAYKEVHTRCETISRRLHSLEMLAKAEKDARKAPTWPSDEPKGRRVELLPFRPARSYPDFSDMQDNIKRNGE